ncbi:MAG: polysaccharide pyruvyl transferase family protein [Anaerolineales bacterium]|nr:polysaccharide pyruvyl transferase family protein [Anaerolineales bacterium]
MKVYLFNRGKDKNIGDTLISEVISHLLAQEGCQITTNPYYSLPKGLFGKLIIHIQSYAQDIINVFKNNITVIGGGNLIMDSSAFGASWAIHHFWLSILNLLFGKKYYYLCVGVAPLKTNLAKKLYRFTVRHATKIAVRDTFSQKYLRDLSGKDDILVWFDPVLLISTIYPKNSSPLGKKKNIGICPIQLYPAISSNLRIYQKYVTLQVKLIEYFVQEDFTVHFFLNDPEIDKKVYADILKQLPETIVPKICGFEFIPSPKDYLELIQSLDFLISSRMHAIITATSYRKPTIGFGWQPKMQYFYQDLNLEGHIALLNKLQSNATVEEIVFETIQLYEKLHNTSPTIPRLTLNLKEFLNLKTT